MSLTALVYNGRSPHGERGLKSPGKDKRAFSRTGRSPHGERGLKLLLPLVVLLLVVVAPHMGSVD